MIKKRRTTKDSLKLAKQYRDILLYDITGGSMGVPLEEGCSFKEGMTVAEKKGILDSLLKTADLDSKVNPKEEESEFDTIKRNKYDSEVDGSEEDN